MVSISNKRARIGIIYGGQSPEHEVSLQSASNIIKSINKEKYELVLIGIDKTGTWYLQDDKAPFFNENDPASIKRGEPLANLAVVPGSDNAKFYNLSESKFLEPLDVIFPIIHGPHGEDGSIQGLLRLLNIPFVGSDILGSAVCMDKDIAKRLLNEAKIPTPKYLTLEQSTYKKLSPTELRRIIDEIQLPLFVKPANLGSSIGVSMVTNEHDLFNAIHEAFNYDRKILIEQYIQGREVECSVLGDEEPVASLPGEVVLNHQKDKFYSYYKKYINEDEVIFKMPTDLPESTVKTIQELSIKAFKTLDCQIMARVDFFVVNSEQVFVNEVNTIPGFTQTSMYPNLWQLSGISYEDLIDRIIQLSIKRHKKYNRMFISGHETNFLEDGYKVE